MGILGGLAVIMLYFVLVYRAFKISLSTTNEFNKAVAMGVGVMLGVQTFIIIGGVIKLIPLTGITLPFVSYGGSSMVATFLSLGVLQGISARGEEIADEI
jgi:cell division protein FtsW (lipid II flippase)